LQIPLQLILFSFPAVIYAAILHRRGEPERQILYKLGLRRSERVYYVWALLSFVAVAVVGFLFNPLLPPNYLDRPMLAASHYAGLELSLLTLVYALFREAIYVTLGEEVLFRGLLGGWLMRRFGYVVGNALQTLAFFLPHLLVLLAGLDLWPLLSFPLAFGWLAGWLRYHSRSILPGWLVHTLANTLAAIIAMN
jgi:uncharacterized protein